MIFSDYCENHRYEPEHPIRDSPPELTSKHRKNGDYVNHYYYKPDNNFIGLVQKQGGKTVYEDYITYDSPEEAHEAFTNL